MEWRQFSPAGTTARCAVHGGGGTAAMACAIAVNRNARALPGCAGHPRLRLPGAARSGGHRHLAEDLGITLRQTAGSRAQNLRCMVGNTPMLAIELRFRGRSRTVYAKAENFNMTGSIKDRMALHVIECGYAARALKPGDLIIEATSGNTGIAIAAIGRALGHPVAIFMPDWMSSERINLMRSLGASIHLVSAADGGFVGAIAKAEALAAASHDIFLPRQFSNDDNCAAHEASTGPEIWLQLQSLGLGCDAFVAGVGTGGTVMGVGRYLRRMNPKCRVHPLEPANSPTLSMGHKVGRHRVQGISDEFIPAIVDLAFLDSIIDVDDGDAIIMAQKLAGEIGIGAGISSGANLLGALQLGDELGDDSVVVTVFPDSNKKYLTTDLMRDEPVRDGFLAPAVELLGFRAIPRACEPCRPPG